MVTPFRLTGTLSMFQRRIDFLLYGVSYITCLVYLGNVILGQTYDRQLSRLREVFSRTRHANLKLKLTKCSLFWHSVSFLLDILDMSYLSKVLLYKLRRSVTMKMQLNLNGV